MWLSNLIQPRSADEDTRRREFILHILLLGTILITLLAIGLLLVSYLQLHNHYVLPRALFLIGGLEFFLLLYILSRRGFSRLAAYALITLYWLIGLYLLYSWSLDLPQGFLVLSLTLVMSSVLLGTNASFLFMILTSVGLAALTVLEKMGRTPANMSWQKVPISGYDTAGFIFVLGIMTVVSWLSNREIEMSLRRARRSELALSQERDRLEQAVDRRTKELKRVQMERIGQLYRLAEFGKLTSGLFHDLVNPLTMVSLNLEQLGASQRSLFIDRAMRGIKHIERFVHAAQKQVKQQEERSIFSIADEIPQVIEILHHRSKDQGVVVQVVGSPTIQLFGNPIKFTQAMTNLIANAIDAYDAATEPGELKPVMVSFERQDRYVRIRIEDHGHGISPEHLHQVFEPFFTTKDLEHGTGIGLSISRNIIQKDFAGVLGVESTLGHGSTFTIILPAMDSLDDYSE